ncbi:8-amino-7-oxononanoate synthase [Acidithiobacillus sp.]|uniref:aminotransferase class I/II-fold pyridoxal phosphate-dependent enzyme n=1 Tax=Acidithiobacillus sp. TaxID=1872118 RepID=UPI0025BA29D3|nr:8-amino-7-oxononanoate synthase [Acidithiobacillus sp.]
MESLAQKWQIEQQHWRAEGLTRSLEALDRAGNEGLHFRDACGRELLSFASNDYLALSGHPNLRRAAVAELARSGVGSGAAPLLGGERPVHAALAEALAAWLGEEAVLLFGSGYLANLGLVQALVGRKDRLYADRLNHASLVDAARLCGARLIRYRHGDPEDLAHRLRQGGSGRAWILSDGVFSMDGDVAPLPELLDLARQHEAVLILDEAHAFGVLGASGRGSLAHFGIEQPGPLLRMGTLGKAFGVYGAFVAGPQWLVDVLRQRARSFVYHTALPAALAAASLAALELLRDAEAERRHLLALRHALREALPQGQWLPSDSPIQALLLGDNARALALSARLREVGFYCPAVRPPTVPPHSARLRITLSAGHSTADIGALAKALNTALAAL